MAIIEHPLSRPLALGELLRTEVFNASAPNERPDWRTRFGYERGVVELRATNNGQTYHYATYMDAGGPVIHN